MAVTKLSNSGIKTGVLKYDSMLAGNAPFDPAATWLIQRVAGTGSSATITFSNIPSTYQHLQIRYIARINAGGTGGSNMAIRINSVTTSSYAFHSMGGNGSAVGVRRSGSATSGEPIGNEYNNYPSSSDLASTMGVGIIDILDYASTTKAKTIRGIGGYMTDGTSQGINFGSNLFNSTSAITSIQLIDNNSFSFTTASSFALYGIKGA